MYKGSIKVLQRSAEALASKKGYNGMGNMAFKGVGVFPMAT